MNNLPILFIDSGIGGLPYCMDFYKKNPQETVYYLADNKNYPYGPRTKEELVSILTALIEKLIKLIQPKIIVLACNTATIAALSSLRQKFSTIPFVGTVPAVKPASLACNSGKIGVLGTERTIQEIHNLNLAEKTCEIFGIAAPELVDFIEMQYDDSCGNSPEKEKIVKKYIKLFREANVDTIVLGCTHFLFLQEEFQKEAAPDLTVFDSLAGITKRIGFLLDENNGILRAEKAGQKKLLLTSTKNVNPFWENRAQKLMFNLEILEL
ncbi:MAG: glutamate racemase [Treponema sp.]|jgi:glutamate racemase|nr:glutamate racemase [Treponema sp.]